MSAPERTVEAEASTIESTLGADRSADDAALRREKRGVGVGAVLLGLFACAWSTLGADLSDDAYNIGSAWRMSLGDQPFVDDMSVRALGSFLAVPFTWLWTQLFGMTGLVLASRVFFVVVAFGVGYLAYRALGTSFRPIVAAVAVAVPLMALPYHLGQISYNTMPIFGLVLGTAAGFAAIRQGNRHWAYACGAAAAAGAISHPLTAPGFVILFVAVLVLARRRNLIVALILGALTVSLPFSLWILLGPGLTLVSDTVRFMTDVQEAFLPPRQRLDVAIDTYTFNLGLRKYWPMWGAAAVATLPRIPDLIRGAALAAVPFLAAVPSFHIMQNTDVVGFGRTTGIFLTVVSLALVVPVTVWSVRSRRRDVGLLIALALPVAIVQVPLTATTTASGVGWGALAVGVCSLLMALIAGWATILGGIGLRLLIPSAAGLVTVVAALLTFTPFKDPFPWQLTTRITSGPFAGVSTDAASAGRIALMTSVGNEWVRPADGVLLYGIAGDYLLMPGKPLTNIMWLHPGEANQAVLEYFERIGDTPDVVIVHRGLVEQHGGFDALAETDPLISYVTANYEQVDQDQDYVVVFRRND